LNVIQIAEKINELYDVLKNVDSPTVIANKINLILLHGEGVPRTLLGASWDIFAKQRGVERSGGSMCE